MFASLRIQFFCFFLLALSLVAATSISSQEPEVAYHLDDGTTFTPATHRLMSRQTAQTTLCFPLTINLVQNGVTTGIIRPRTCYCNYQGTLTPATVTDINNAFTTTSTQINQTNFNSYLQSNGQTRAQGIAGIKTSIQNALNQRTATCVYGPGAVPNSCDACSFTCSSTTTKPCGTSCIANTATCASGLPSKRDLDRNRCATGWEVCETGAPGFGGKSAGWECVDTRSDLESCGGCQQPLQGRPAGVDCTAIVGINGVACVSGVCQINSCLKGYELVNNACNPVTHSASSAAASSASALAAKRSAAAHSAANVVVAKRSDASPNPAASIIVDKRFTEETKPTERGQHKVWHKRAKQPTKNQRRR